MALPQDDGKEPHAWFDHILCRTRGGSLQLVLLKLRMHNNNA